MKVIDFESYIAFASVVNKFLNSESGALCIYRTLVAVERLLITALRPFRSKLSPEEIERDNINMDKLVVLMGDLFRAREEILKHQGPEFAKAVADDTLEKVVASGILDGAGEEEQDLVTEVLTVLTNIEE